MKYEEKKKIAEDILSDYLSESGLMILNKKQKHLVIGAMIEFNKRLASDGALADVRLSLCCKAPIDKDDDTSQYCTNCLDACESYSA